MGSDSRKRNLINRFMDLKPAKKFVIVLDLFFWFICIKPVVGVIIECIDGAVNGVVPGASDFWNDSTEMIYGMEAVKDILSVYCSFLIFGVLLWLFFLIFTIGFTVYAVSNAYYKKPQLYTDEGGFLHIVGEEETSSQRED